MFFHVLHHVKTSTRVPCLEHTLSVIKIVSENQLGISIHDDQSHGTLLDISDSCSYKNILLKCVHSLPFYTQSNLLKSKFVKSRTIIFTPIMSIATRSFLVGHFRKENVPNESSAQLLPPFSLKNQLYCYNKIHIVSKQFPFVLDINCIHLVIFQEEKRTRTIFLPNSLHSTVPPPW